MSEQHADLYAALGLDQDATQSQLSAAYRALLRQHHPDTRARQHGQQDVVADATLQQIIAAYAVLRDPRRRADYDQRTAANRLRASHRIEPRRSTARRTEQPPIQAGPVHWYRRAGP